MVADFGLSDWISDLEDGSSPICGTPGYMAPEVPQYFITAFVNHLKCLILHQNSPS